MDVKICLYLYDIQTKRTKCCYFEGDVLMVVRFNIFHIIQHTSYKELQSVPKCLYT